MVKFTIQDGDLSISYSLKKESRPYDIFNKFLYVMGVYLGDDTVDKLLGLIPVEDSKDIID